MVWITLHEDTLCQQIFWIMGERKFQRSNGVDDLVLLEEVTADSIVDNLRMRFTKDLIYSYIGPVLVRL